MKRRGVSVRDPIDSKERRESKKANARQRFLCQGLNNNWPLSKRGSFSIKLVCSSREMLFITNAYTTEPDSPFTLKFARSCDSVAVTLGFRCTDE